MTIELSLDFTSLRAKGCRHADTNGYDVTVMFQRYGCLLLYHKYPIVMTVKCHCSIQSMSETLSKKWYQRIQYIKRHHMSLMPLF